MIQGETVDRSGDGSRTGRDELNLTEFPFALLKIGEALQVDANIDDGFLLLFGFGTDNLHARLIGAKGVATIFALRLKIGQQRDPVILA